MQRVTEKRKPGGSVPGKASNVRWDFNVGLQRLQDDYFRVGRRSDERAVERGFWLPRSVFNRLQSKVVGKGIFLRRTDGLGRQDIHPIQRIVVALRLLAYGGAFGSVDEYLQLSETSAALSLKAFCRIVVTEFGAENLRQPNEDDLRRIIGINAARGFPGCIGSIDCKHFNLKMCPVALAGQFSGKSKATIVLEAIADGELWVWHCFFGSPGSLNDINILYSSTTINGIMRGDFPPKFKYNVKGRERVMPYYLADGIYPDWPIFQKTIKDVETRKERTFSGAQEALRKDIERAFGVLVDRFQILDTPARM